MSAIDFERHAGRLLGYWPSAYLGAQQAEAAARAMEVLRAVALEAGAAVQAAHREWRLPAGDPRTCATCRGDGCHGCGETGVADAATVLGIERPR